MWKITKKKIKQFLELIKLYKSFKDPSRLLLFNSFLMDYNRVCEFSYVGKTDNPTKDFYLVFINIYYHSIEKGLAFKDFRPGFGKKKIIELSSMLTHVIQDNNSEGELNKLVLYASSVLHNYLKLHNEIGYVLDVEVQNAINSVLSKTGNMETVDSIQEYRLTNTQTQNDELTSLIKNRRSVRHFINKTPSIGKVKKAVKMAANCPSACNRQAYIVRYTDNRNKIENILKIQGGTSGFSAIPGLLIITFSRKFYHNSIERNSGFIDSGIYIMNLVYTLILEGLGSCILNNAFNEKKDKKMRECIKDVNQYEEFVAFLAIGETDTSALSPASHKALSELIVLK